MNMNPFTPEDLFAQIAALERALGEERAARAEAEAACARKSDLVASVSHELRTAMGAIISMADFLLATDLNAAQCRFAETLQQSARALLAVLNDILDFSKLEAGKFELAEVTFDLRKLLQSVGEGLAARAREKRIETVLDIAADCPDLVVGDPVRLRQVLNNLLDNALKFTARGSIRLRVEVAVGGGAATLLRFAVTDTGVGLPEGDARRLFEPYAQAGSTVALDHGGTGLGLSIARRLAELMGGAIGCESVPGQGSLFWFTARLRHAAREAPPLRMAKAGAPAPEALAGHVLMVEDNVVNQMLIAAYLERFGVTHDIAVNGRHAVEALKTRPYDLVLMDVMMPDVDGIAATRMVRALDGPAGAVPIVALTANAMKGDRETYLGAGMNGYVSKPIDAGELFAAMAEHLPAAAARAS